MANLTQHQIQILNPISGDLTNLAGSGDPGFDNGTGTAAKLNRPYGLALLPDGDMLVADQSNNRIRRVTASGVVSTFAGTGAIGSGNGNRTSATFNGPQDIKYNQLDNALYVADTLNHIIRKIDGDTVTTIAGNGMPGYVEGIGTAASFFGLEGIGVDLRNNDLIVADGSRGEDEPYHRVRRVNL
jgi:DNA-binding beta-propeller fold protein YncE